MSRLNGFAPQPISEALLAQQYVVPAPHNRPQITNCRDEQPLDLRTILDEAQQILPQSLVKVAGMLMGRRPGQLLEMFTKSSQLFAFIGANARVEWRQGPRYLTQDVFFEFARQNVEAFDAIEYFPHDRAAERILYHHPALPPSTGQHLTEFLDFFRYASPLDRTLFESFALSLCVQLPGKKPLFVFTNPPNAEIQTTQRETGRGIGKTTAVGIIADICGGMIEISPDSDEDRLRSRLLSDGASGKRLVRLDNVKSDRLSCAMIERLITSREISGHRLYRGEGSLHNHFVFAMTINGPNFSEDLAARSVFIRLTRPAYDPAWDERIEEFIAERRWNLISDILAKLHAPAVVTISEYGRFPAWEARVLSRCQGGDAALVETRRRRQEVDADLADVQEIQDLLNQRPTTPNGRIAAADMARIVEEVTGEKRASNKLKKYLERLSVPGLRWGGRGNSGRYYIYQRPATSGWTPTAPSNSETPGP